MRHSVHMIVPIEKVDAPQRLVFGWASVIEEGGKPVVDRQGDTITPEELEKAAYQFVAEARAGKAGEMHIAMGVGELVESTVFTREKQAALGIDLGRVGWWIGFRVTPEVFAKVQDGTYTAFSIGGRGKRVTAEAQVAERGPSKAKSFAESLFRHRVPAKATTSPAPAGQVTADDVAALAKKTDALARTVAEMTGQPQPDGGGESPLVKAAKAAAERVKGGA